MNTITLERRGCDFSDPEMKLLSDVGNYRVGIYDYSIHCINGRDYILEFGGYKKYEYRTTNKRTGAPLKKPVKQLIRPNALYIDTTYENNDGSWRDCGLEDTIMRMDLSFTKADILRAINMISETKYDNLVIK